MMTIKINSVILTIALQIVIFTAGPTLAQILPDTSWYRYESPEQAGFSSEGIAEAKAYADSLGSKAVMLIHNGAIVTEWGNTAELAPVASIRKSMFSALIGIAADEGVIDTSSTIGELGITDSTPLTELEKRATVRNLLTTSSGVYLPASGEGPGNNKPPRGIAEPGEQWFYNNWDFNVLASIYEQETGMGMYQAMEEKLADPLGMESYDINWGSYRYQPNRSEHASFHLWMTARDMARFGLLYLNEGRWGSEQIVPESWVEESRRNLIDVPYEPVAGFGLSWWIPAGQLSEYDAYLAAGAGSQVITIIPKLDMVYVQRASAILERGVDGLQSRDIFFKLLDAKVGESVEDPTYVAVE